MSDRMSVREGQIYRCLRRGHTVDIEKVSSDRRRAYYENARGESRSISTERLANPALFKLIAQRATMPLVIYEKRPPTTISRDVCELNECDCNNTSEISANEIVNPA